MPGFCAAFATEGVKRRYYAIRFNTAFSVRRAPASSLSMLRYDDKRQPRSLSHRTFSYAKHAGRARSALPPSHIGDDVSTNYFIAANTKSGIPHVVMPTRLLKETVFTLSADSAGTHFSDAGLIFHAPEAAVFEMKHELFSQYRRLLQDLHLVRLLPLVSCHDFIEVFSPGAYRAFGGWLAAFLVMPLYAISLR